MAKKNRPSVLKRLREAEKRQRQARKAAKAALKRERRFEKTNEQPAIAQHEVVQDDPEPRTDPPAESS